MMIRTLLSMSALLLPSLAVAGDFSAGVLVGGSLDLPDTVSKGTTSFGPGPSVSIPLRYRVGEAAWLRLDLRGDLGVGQDQVTWVRYAGDEPVRLSSNDHWSMLTAAVLAVGADVRAPTDWPVLPQGGVSVGGTWVATWHSFGPGSDGATDTTFLLDPSQNDPTDPNNIDPWAGGFAALVDVHGGVAIPASDSVEVVIETGYSVAFLPEAELRKAPSDLDARREAFGWNAIRLQAGVSFTF